MSWRCGWFAPFRASPSCMQEKESHVSCEWAHFRGNEMRDRQRRRTEPKTQVYQKTPLLMELQACGGRRKPYKTADFRRKSNIFTENRTKPQIGSASVFSSFSVCFSEKIPKVGESSKKLQMKDIVWGMSVTSLAVMFFFFRSRFGQSFCTAHVTLHDKSRQHIGHLLLQPFG